MSQWTSKQVALRFEECVKVIKALPEGNTGGYKSFWPEIKYTPEEIAKQEKRKLILRPLPEAIDRASEVLGWIAWIDQPEYRHLLWLKARRVPWHVIPRETGLTVRTARRRHSESLEVIAQRLNNS